MYYHVLSYIDPTFSPFLYPFVPFFFDPSHFFPSQNHLQILLGGLGRPLHRHQLRAKLFKLRLAARCGKMAKSPNIDVVLIWLLMVINGQ